MAGAFLSVIDLIIDREFGLRHSSAVGLTEVSFGYVTNCEPACSCCCTRSLSAAWIGVGRVGAGVADQRY